MDELNNQNVKIIKNATRGDVLPGDHLILEKRRTWRGATITTRREGIAHHRDGDGDWCTEDGAWLTDFSDADYTLTIRRPVQDLPTRVGSTIVTNDENGAIEATTDGLVWRAREAVLGTDSRWHGVWRRDPRVGALTSVTPQRIVPNTWKVDGE